MLTTTTDVPEVADVQHLLLPYVSDLLLHWPQDRAWQQLEGTLVSADISGFTALSERLASRGREGAEELTALINDCFEGMIENCHRNGGDIVKFGGDALLVWFMGDSHARRACRAAVAMRRTLRNERRTSDGKLVKLKVSIGAHSDLHTFFMVRSGHCELVVTGPGVTHTVDCESAASAGEILITHQTAKLLPASWLGEVRPEGVIVRHVTAAKERSSSDATSTSTSTSRSNVSLASPTPSAAAFIPPEQQAQIVAGAVNEHRQVAISFVEFSGTDALIAEGQIDTLSDRLQTFTDSVAAACSHYGAYWLATDVYHDGGKFILTAGVPLSLGQVEERMLRAVRDIIDADPGINLRAGINRGYVFAGDLGSDRRRTYTTMGDAVNLSARLMSKATSGEIIVSRPTMEWASSRFEYAPLEPFFVKGKSVPIYAGQLGRWLGRQSELDGVDVELCGRTDELARMLALADGAALGQSSVVMVTGEPGIGKSRLAVEVARQRPDFAVAIARCQPFDRLSAYSVTEPLIRAMLGIGADATSTEAGTMLVEWLMNHAPTLVPFAPLLALTVGADVASTREADAVIPEFRRLRTLQLLVEIVNASISAPTIVFIDDINHADDATRELVEALVSGAGRIPLFIIATSVPDDTLAGERITLGGLNEREVSLMIDSLLGDRAISAATVRNLVQRSDGNPLFVTELLKVLSEDPHAAMPSSLESLVESRIDTLEPADRQLLRFASVLGNVVDIRLLAQMSDESLVSRQDRWDRLDRFLERVGPGVVRFRYDTFQRVVYEGLSFRARRGAHSRVVELLEGSPDEDEREQLALLAFHAHRAGDESRTWTYSCAAAAAAAEDAMFGEAARLYALALATHRHGATDDELRVIAERAGDVYESAGQFDKAEHALGLSLRHATEGLDQARLWRKRAEVAERTGDYARVQRLLARAAKALAGVPWTQAIGEHARWETAQSAFALRQSRLEDAWKYATGAFASAQLIEDWKTAAHAALMLDNMVTTLRWEGTIVQRPDVVQLYQRAKDPIGEAKYLSNRAVDHYFDGEWHNAIRLHRESSERSAEYGHVVSEATGLNNIAEILSDQGHYDEARQMLREASRTWRSTGYGIGIALAEANLGRLATRTGQYEEAQAMLEASAQRFAELGAGGFVVEVALRIVDNALLAGRTVTEDMWPSSEELDQDPTLQVYANRLRALHAFGRASNGAVALIDTSIATARSAGLPFELALSLLARSRIVVDDDAAREAATLLASLDVVNPPPFAVVSSSGEM